MIRRVSTSQLSLLFSTRFNIIRHKDILEIQSKYGDTKMEQLKMKFNVAKHIITMGGKNVLGDARSISDVFAKVAQKKELTPEEEAKYDKFRLNL